MVRPDYRVVKILCHSAKGSTWEDHKYVKRVNGIYYYPNGTDGARTMESFQKDLRNKRFTQKQVNADASNKQSSTSSTSTASKTSTKSLVRSKTETSSLSSFSKPAAYTDKALEDEDKEIEEETKTDDTKKTDSKKDIEELAKEVIKGKHGNGASRKKALGDDYEAVQKKVNELMKKSGNTKISSTSSAAKNSSTTSSKSTSKSSTSNNVKKKEEKKETTSSTATTKKGLDYEKIYSVYNKRKKR